MVRFLWNVIELIDRSHLERRAVHQRDDGFYLVIADVCDNSDSDSKLVIVLL